jgi:hypothetical protein
MKYAILALLLLIPGVVYAEESIVQVPFDYHGQSCTFNEIAVEYQCIWQGKPDPITIEELESFKGGLHDRLIDEAIAKLESQALEEIAIQQAILTPTERLIESLEKKYTKGDISGPDLVLLQMLYELDTCRQGMDNRTLHIQSPREFEISLADDYLYNHVSYEHKLGDLVKSIEECKGQQHIYKASVGYANMVGGEDDVWYDHRSLYEGVQAIPYDKFMATSNEIDMSTICDNHQFSDQHKAQAGCQVLYDGKSAEQIKRENKLMFGTDGMVQYQSETLDRYNEFMSTYGNIEATIQDKKIQAELVKPIVEELLEDNLFYQKHKE